MRDKLIELSEKAHAEWLQKEYDHETQKSIGEFVADYLLENGVVISEDKAKIEITPYDTPWQVACALINAKYEQKDVFNRPMMGEFFLLEDLKRIGEHLVNYSKAESE